MSYERSIVQSAACAHRAQIFCLGLPRRPALQLVRYVLRGLASLHASYSGRHTSLCQFGQTCSGNRHAVTQPCAGAQARLTERLCKECNFDTPSLSARIHARQLRRSLRGSPPPSGRPCTRRATVLKMRAAHHRLARSERASAEAPRRAQRRGCSARAGRR